jgi:hypothetical protein
MKLIMDFTNLTAPCGIPCFECVSYKAKFNEALQKRISENLGIDFENAKCEGCRNRKGVGFLSGKNNIFPEGNCSLLDKNGVCLIYRCAER